jgi:hypothetical protein
MAATLHRRPEWHVVNLGRIDARSLAIKLTRMRSVPPAEPPPHEMLPDCFERFHQVGHRFMRRTGWYDDDLFPVNRATAANMARFTGEFK